MKCKKHPKYMGVYKPRTGCSQCYELYASKLRIRDIEKDRSKNKDINEYLEVKNILNRLGNLGAYWKKVVIHKSKLSKWEIESSVRIDNGYGGKIQTISVQGDDFIEIARDFLNKIEDNDSLYKHRYM